MCDWGPKLSNAVKLAFLLLTDLAAPGQGGLPGSSRQAAAITDTEVNLFVRRNIYQVRLRPLADARRVLQAVPNGSEFFEQAPADTNFQAASFASLHLSRPLLKACAELGYTTPTPVQVRMQFATSALFADWLHALRFR